MSRTCPVEITVMCMVYDHDKILVQDRKKQDWPGISFPGGHLEAYESFTDAVIREVKEETGLTICHPVMCGMKDWYNDDGSRYMVVFFRTNEFSGELCSSEEGEVFWLSLDDLKNHKLGLDFEEMLEIFRRDDLSEFFYYQENEEWKIRIT